jgi:ferredoxin-NADP reductase
MVATRMRKTAFNNALKAAAVGTKFTVSRPRGSFTLHRAITRPAVFLAGGIGIAPIRSILQQAAQERLPHKRYLFYANREAEDAAFLDELKSVTAQNPNFTFVPTVTGHRTLAWPYEKGTSIARCSGVIYWRSKDLSTTSRALREWSRR